MNTYQQVAFKQGDRKMVCWTDQAEKLKPGTICDLKQVEGYWEVEEVYPHKMQKANINRTWHVGGL